MLFRSLLHITNNFTDWSKLTKTAETSAAKELKETLKTTAHTAGRPKQATTAKEAEVDYETMFKHTNL